MPMNQEIKARWVAWLRANADKQTTGRLNRVTSDRDTDPVGFCCLGGLCELAVQDGVIGALLKESKEHGDFGTVMTYGNASVGDYYWSTTSLPSAVTRWAGLSSSDPEVRITSNHGEWTTNLTSVNDDEQYDFNQIADLIEAQL